MLWALNASSLKFKALTFRSGLNIIIADRDRQSGEDEAHESRRRSRNGAGKSSIVDLIHFLLGGEPQGALKSDALADWTFELTLDLRGARKTVSRVLSNRKKLTLKDSDLVMRQPSISTNAAWSRQLGQVWFRLNPGHAVGDASFRQMFSYFARRKRDGGFDDPVRTFRMQSIASIETNLAHLFGLDAELVRRLHQTKAALKQTQSAQRVLADIEKVTPVGARRVDLEAQLAAQIAASELIRNRLRERVEAFNVLPAFRDLERELAELNQEARDLSDDDVLDEEAITVNRRSLEAEEIPETPNLERLFHDAQVIFPDVITRRYEEVFRFHERLIANRQAHLAAELAASRRRIEERRPRREQLESRRREITASLRTSGPADELLRLRDELAAKEAGLRALQARLEEARSLEQKAEQLQIELDLAVRALRQDRRERSAIVDEASRTFSEISERLYERPGQLAISANENGVSFLPTTPADQSAGVMSMQIFCFDLTLATLCSRRGIGPGFLIHDSHLFEPVDGRQFAKALRIAAAFAAESGVQYIATLNSDELARAELEGEENFSDFVLDTKLSDTPEGGLFGIRFD
jgi:uncharacterized protein YydD (DUF2326 family)